MMLQNKIIISGGKKNGERAEKPDSFEYNGRHSPVEAAGAGTGSGTTEPVEPADQDTMQAEQPPVDENVWGNDYTLLNKLSEKQLADRRLFVRIRHIQWVECHIVFDNIKSEPFLLDKPLVFIINELSMAGIGIICDHAISIGKILAFQFTIDNIPYDIKCEVIYCIPNDDKFRACLKVVQRDKRFMKHLKIFIARTSLNLAYGRQESANLSNSHIRTQLMA